jgi:23S rRNA G2069 N7-methylase RlmK/C1962 C5-methylase RlmI
VRIVSGDAEGVPGVFIDAYGSPEANAAVMMVYEGRAPRAFAGENAANRANEALQVLGRSALATRAVYVKPFPKDRPKLGGELPANVTQAAPAAGEAMPDSMVIREVDWHLEVRMYDGLSTGLFLDQRENRAAMALAIARRRNKQQTTGISQPLTVLNTFAYTCAFSVACAKAGAVTTSVDVSGRYLDWGRRNFAHNGLDASDTGPHRFARMDTFEFFAYARRKGLTYDLIILDPPSFAAGSKKKGIQAFSSMSDYATLVREATELLRPHGAIFASTNTQELCVAPRAGEAIRLEREIVKALGKEPRWLRLPVAADDFSMERGRFAARFFAP